MVNLKPCLGRRIFIYLTPVGLISDLYMSEGFVLWLGHVLHQAPRVLATLLLSSPF